MKMTTRAEPKSISLGQNPSQTNWQPRVILSQINCKPRVRLGLKTQNPALSGSQKYSHPAIKPKNARLHRSGDPLPL